MPGVNSVTLPADAAATAQDDLTNILTHPPSKAEPPLECYVFAKRKKHEKRHNHR